MVFGSWNPLNAAGCASTAEPRSSCIIDDADCPPLMITRFVIVFRWFTKETGLTMLESHKRPRGPSCRHSVAAERTADDSVSAAQALPLALPSSHALVHNGDGPECFVFERQAHFQIKQCTRWPSTQELRMSARAAGRWPPENQCCNKGCNESC